MAKLVSMQTPDGVLHESLCLITSELHINHGAQIVGVMDAKTKTLTNRQRTFSFQAKVQGFHTQADAEAGRMPIPEAAFVAIGSNLQYFQYAAMTLHDMGLTPSGAGSDVIAAFQATKLADVVDAAVWYAVQKSNPKRFADAQPATLGDCVFTNPSKSRVIPS